MKLVFLSLLFMMGMISFSQNKVVLLEEGTGTWCQYCPRGEVFGKQVLQDHPGQVLLVAIHQNDPMEIPGAAYFNNFFWGGLPNAFTDRGTVHDPDEWPSRVASALSQSPPAGISISRTYDTSTRVLLVDVTADWFALNSGVDYRLGAIAIEDAVTGPPPNYSQSNAYSGGIFGAMGGFENMPDPVPAGLMVYDHVARDLLSPFDGIQGSIPPNPQPGQSYTQQFAYSIPLDQDPEYVRVYGFMTDMVSGGVISNAGSSEYAIGDLNARPMFHSDSVFSVFAGTNASIDVLAHDPDNDTLTLTVLNGLPSWASFNQIGNNDARITGSPSASGVHNILVEASDGLKTRTVNIVIDVQFSPFSWTQVGAEGFTSQTPAYNCEAAIEPNSGKAYASLIDANDVMHVYEHDNGNWTQLGSSIVCDHPFGFELHINPASSEVWVAFRDQSGMAKVQRYSGGSWLDVGAPVPGGQDIEFAFAPNGDAFMCTKSPSGGPAYVYEFDGNSWNSLGGALSIPGSVAVAWLSMEYNSVSGQPVLLANGFPSNAGYSHVLEWDGGGWVIIGGGPINPNEFTSGSAASLHQLAVTPSGEYFTMIAHSNGTSVYYWDGLNWITIANNIDNGVREVFDIIANSLGEIFALYQNTQGGLTCEKWDGVNWTLIGNQNFTPTIDGDADMVIYDQDLPGVVYIDNAQGNKLSMKRYGSPMLGVSEVANETILLYPNPSNGDVFVNDVKNGDRFSVYDAVGALVMKGTVADQRIKSGVLADGIYSIRFESRVGIARLVKE